MSSRQGSGAVVNQIEAMLEPVLASLKLNQPASVTLASKKRGIVTFEEIRFPGRSLLEARKFARVILILQLAHDSVVSGTVLTKRNVFYQNQDLFTDQTSVDSLVDAVALTLAAAREDINIVATSKGVVSGRALIRLVQSSLLDLSVGDCGTPIPLCGTIESIVLTHARWVLVVEKDAVFKTLSSTQYWENATAGPGILVTGKGYPDLITRNFLQTINRCAPDLPLLTLTDYDVDGLNIARCYRYNMDPTSRKPATVNLGISWLGIRTSHVVDLASSISPSTSGHVPAPTGSRFFRGDSISKDPIASTECRDPINGLTTRDRKVAVTVVATLSDHAATDQAAADLKSEAQRMLMLGVKCEIQWLDESGNLHSWLDRELLRVCRVEM